MKIYNLEHNENGLITYYEIINNFVSNFFRNVSDEIWMYIDKYKDFITKNYMLPTRTAEEIICDIIALNILYKNYIRFSASTNIVVIYVMICLFYIRNKFIKPKKIIDFFRGFISSNFMLKSKVKNDIPFSYKELNKLLLWLSATGEYKEEVIRFYQLKVFLDTLKANEKTIIINKFYNLSLEFEKIAEKELGYFTSNVDEFINNTDKLYINREDYIFTRRHRNEYHLNLFWAEVLNIVHENKFNNTKKKILLLPGCMRMFDDKHCKAEKRKYEKICRICSKNCNVAQITLKGQKFGFEVFIIPHATDFSKWVSEHSIDKEIGVIGVACILNLLSGGLELKRVGVDAQCIILNYPGCKKHWQKEEISTNINEEKLFKIIKVDNNR